MWAKGGLKCTLILGMGFITANMVNVNDPLWTSFGVVFCGVKACGGCGGVVAASVLCTAGAGCWWAQPWPSQHQSWPRPLPTHRPGPVWPPEPFLG